MDKIIVLVKQVPDMEKVKFDSEKGVIDRKFGGSDVKATASILAAAIKKSSPFSMIVSGVQTVDGDTGQVGPEVAQLLDIHHAGYAETLYDADEDKITVATRIWEGLYKKTLAYPVLITVTKEIAEPRLPSLKRKMQARKAEIPVWGMDDLKDYITDNDAGLKGSATWVKKIVIPEAAKRSGEVYRFLLSYPY